MSAKHTPGAMRAALLIEQRYDYTGTVDAERERPRVSGRIELAEDVDDAPHSVAYGAMALPSLKASR